MSSNTDNEGCVELIKPRGTAKSACQHIGPHVKVFAEQGILKNVISCLIMTGVTCVRRNQLITDFFRQRIFNQQTKSAPG